MPQSFPPPVTPSPPQKRLVLKLGSQILVDDQGTLAIERLASYARQLSTLMQQGWQVVLVSSGAIGLGQLALKLKHSELTPHEKRACAAVGQARLMQAYEQLFQHYGRTVAQVLLNSRHFAERWHYVNMRKTMETLLAFGVIPIVNENDTLADPQPEGADGQALSFGDNDKLSALVAAKLDADLLVILSNVDGVYSENPKDNPSAKRLPCVRSLSDLRCISTLGKSVMGRGGMQSKLEAVACASLCGVSSVIGSGLMANSLLAIVRAFEALPEDNFQTLEAFPATLVLPAQPTEKEPFDLGYKRWIGVSSGYQGVVVLNAGAVEALTQRGASLLPVGILEVRGEFYPNQVLSLRDESDHEWGRGQSSYSSQQLSLIAGASSTQFSDILGTGDHPHEAVHRDRLVLF
jgi:glutamate 5-kinase